MSKVIDFKTGKEISLKEEPSITYDLQDYFNGQILDLIRCLINVCNIPQEYTDELGMLLSSSMETLEKIIINKNNLV